MADSDLQDNDILGEKPAGAVLKLSEDNAKAISKGLFRYAVQLEMVMRVLAEISEYTPEQVEKMRREAINNVRRTRGKVSFEDILAAKQRKAFWVHEKSKKNVCGLSRQSVVLWCAEKGGRFYGKETSKRRRQYSQT